MSTGRQASVYLWEPLFDLDTLSGKEVNKCWVSLIYVVWKQRNRIICHFYDLLLKSTSWIPPYTCETFIFSNGLKLSVIIWKWTFFLPPSNFLSLISFIYHGLVYQDSFFKWHYGPITPGIIVIKKLFPISRTRIFLITSYTFFSLDSYFFSNTFFVITSNIKYKMLKKYYINKFHCTIN